MLQSARDFHLKHIEPHTGPAVGASQSQVVALEGLLGFTLPAAYREFLLWLGNDETGIFQGSNCFIDDIINNNKNLVGFLAQYNLPIPTFPFVAFFAHQGYSFLWFQHNSSIHDPEVIGFSEGYEQQTVCNIGRFSQWLVAEFEALSGGSAS